MMMQPAYRLFQVKHGQPHTIKHGWHGSRQLPLDRTLRAEVDRVWNPGTKTGPGYVSGWHVTRRRAEAERYLRQFKHQDDKVVCRVWVSELQPKPRSPHAIELARFMLIDSEDWCRAINREVVTT